MGEAASFIFNKHGQLYWVCWDSQLLFVDSCAWSKVLILVFWYFHWIQFNLAKGRCSVINVKLSWTVKHLLLCLSRSYLIVVWFVWQMRHSYWEKLDDFWPPFSFCDQYIKCSVHIMYVCRCIWMQLAKYAQLLRQRNDIPDLSKGSHVTTFMHRKCQQTECTVLTYNMQSHTWKG